MSIGFGCFLLAIAALFRSPPDACGLLSFPDADDAARVSRVFRQYGGVVRVVRTDSIATDSMSQSILSSPRDLCQLRALAKANCPNAAAAMAATSIPASIRPP